MEFPGALRPVYAEDINRAKMMLGRPGALLLIAGHIIVASFYGGFIGSHVQQHMLETGEAM